MRRVMKLDLRACAWMLAALMLMDGLLAEEKTWVGGSSWNDPAAWSPAGVPALGDDIRIGSGVVSVPGTVEVSGGLTWTGGQIQGGLLRILPGGVLHLEGDQAKTLHSVGVSSAGQVRLRGSGPLEFRFSGYNQGVVFTNEPGGMFEITEEADLVQVNPGGWPPSVLVFANHGLLRKVGGGTNVLSGIPLNSTGSVELQGGHMGWQGGGVSSGLFTVEAGASMDLLSGGFQLEGARFEGGGPVRIRGNLTLSGRFRAANFGLASGLVGGDAEIAGAFEWTGGTLSSTRLKLGEGRHFIRGDGVKEMLASSLHNEGSLRVEGSVLGLRFTGYNQACTITNGPGGILEMAGSAVLEQRNAGGWPPAVLALANAGVLRSEGEGTNRIESIPLTGGGRIEVVSGSLRHQGGGVLSGEAVLGEGARMELGGGGYQLAGSRWTGAGVVRVVTDASLQGGLSCGQLRG